MARRRWLILVCLVVAAGLAFGFAALRRPAVAAGETKPAGVDTKPGEVRAIGVWQPPAGLTQIPLWPNGAPDMAGVSQPPESVLTAQTPEAIGGHTSQAVFDVAAPTMTVFPPKGRNTGVGVVVFPGGGFQILATTIEGTEICDWLTARGITCILVKYRVPNTDPHWDKTCKCAVVPKIPRALQDGQRAIKLVRSQAGALHLDPGKIGVMGFSAGGYLVAQTSNIFEPAYKPVDAIDALSSRPDFAVAVYPGHLCREGGALDPTIHVTKKTPPTFLLAAWDDPVDDICNSTVYARALDAGGAPAEVHIFGKGGHAFGLRGSSRVVEAWPGLVEAWLHEIAML